MRVNVIKQKQSYILTAITCLIRLQTITRFSMNHLEHKYSIFSLFEVVHVYAHDGTSINMLKPGSTNFQLYKTPSKFLRVTRSEVGMVVEILFRFNWVIFA